MTDSLADDQLVRQIAEGDARAFTTLFRRRRGEIYRFALHMTASPATAEDITQDVFVTVIRQAGRFEPGRATVTAWLCGIARNHVRRRVDHEKFVEPFLDSDESQRRRAIGSADDPVDQLERARRIDVVRRVVMSLPFRYREVVVLCDLQEMSYIEAAAALDCAVGTVRSRLHRARALLATKLREADRRTNSVRLRNPRCLTWPTKISNLT